MIKTYTGKGWFLNDKGEKTPCEYSEKDGMKQAVCDICGDCVCDEDGDGVGIFPDESEANDMAYRYYWIVLGKHHICPNCYDKIDSGKIDIEIKVKGADNGK